MKSALVYSDLWDVVQNANKDFPTDLPVTPAPTAAQATAYQAQLKTWKQTNNQASELIYSMCEDKPAEAIEDDEVAMNRWIKLKNNYSDSGFVLRFIKL